jgi:hypothetical protein
MSKQESMRQLKVCIRKPLAFGSSGYESIHQKLSKRHQKDTKKAKGKAKKERNKRFKRAS